MVSVIWHPSPNFGPRRGDARPSMIVIHYTAMASAAEALARLCDPLAEVSAHYLIAESGAVFALVAEEMRAWHAGAGEWAGITDVNSHSIGIELANPGDRPFAHRQMLALEGLLREVMARWSIRPERVIGHSDMAPGRKGDPGRQFDWRRLALQGCSIWPDPAPPSPVDYVAFRTCALRFGYPAVENDVLLAAVRWRFRPWAKGPLELKDIEVVRALAVKYTQVYLQPKA